MKYFFTVFLFLVVGCANHDDEAEDPAPVAMAFTIPPAPVYSVRYKSTTCVSYDVGSPYAMRDDDLMLRFHLYHEAHLVDGVVRSASVEGNVTNFATVPIELKFTLYGYGWRYEDSIIVEPGEVYVFPAPLTTSTESWYGGADLVIDTVSYLVESA
jgi:hypothetical protein